LKDVTNIKVNAPNVNTTWINASRTILHTEDRYDVGVILLSSDAEVSTFPSIFTLPAFCDEATLNPYFTYEYVSTAIGTAAELENNSYRMRANMFGRVLNGQLSSKPRILRDEVICTRSNTYYERNVTDADGESGDSGSPVVLVDANGQNPKLHSIVIASGTYAWSNTTLKTTLFMQLQWVAPWLAKVAADKAYVDPRAYSLSAPNTTKYRAAVWIKSTDPIIVTEKLDIWRKVAW